MLLEEAVSTSRSIDDVSFYQMLPEAVRIALRCMDTELAGSISGMVGGELPAVRHAQATIAALLAEQGGRHGAAATSFADAAAAWRDFGVPYEEAQSLLGQGRCLIALGRAPEATTPLQEAHQIFERLGARPAMSEAAVLLSAVADES